MEITYGDPIINEDGSIIIEQVTVVGSDELSNGIKRRELKVIQELYPNLELLEETIKKAKSNYENVEMQGDKTVGQLDQEKKALKELEKAVKKIKSK